MAFLLGVFGTASLMKNMQERAQTALQKAGLNQTHIMLLPHGILYAGQNNKHAHVYNHIVSLATNGGIIVGKLFDRANNRPVIMQHEIAQQWSRNPSLLYQEVWGRFIGALYNQDDHTLTLVRDPLGLSTMFYCQQPGGIVFSTNVSLIYEILEEKPSLDFSFFAEYIIHTNQALPTTPFQEIKELLPGMALTIDAQGNIKQNFMWDIGRLRGSFITDEREMEEHLLAVLKSSVKAWTHDTDGICLELSGGLDSSAVLIALREVLPADKKIIAVNFIDSKTPSSNEHEHAQEVADLCKVPLHLMDQHAVSLLSPLPSGWLPNKPSVFLFAHRLAAQTYEFALSHGCHDIFNGQGGDHVFLAPAPQSALADYWLDHGFKGIMKPLANISAAHRTSWPSLVYTSAQDIVRYYRGKTVRSTALAPFLTADYVQTLLPHDFYLNDKLTKLYPAKSTHLQALAHAVFYADRDLRSTQMVASHPLLSLPLVELALTIPTYQSFNDAYDRIFFRRVATKMKPAKSLWRTIKGQTTGTMTKQLACEVGHITELLMQGNLVKSGLINKQWLDDELIKIRHGNSDNMWPLLHLLASQLWLNQWKL